MKVAFVAPNYSWENRGNGVTVRRIERNLRAMGCDIAVFPTEEFGAEMLLQSVSEFAPDCIHAFHAWHGGRAALSLSARLGVPFVVTITGTDVYGERDDRGRAELGRVLAAASGVAVFHESVRGQLLLAAPELASRITIIPQGVTVPLEPPPETAGEFVFLLPAGIRPVKNVTFPIIPLSRIHDEQPMTRLKIVGPMLDRDYGTMVTDALAPFSWASYGGERTFAQMASEYAAAHVVLNTSVAEGGMANSLLEAMAFGRPVLAADIDGNRSLICDGVNGLLYRDETDFALKAGRLMAEPALRQRLGLAARRFVRENCSPTDEAEKYLELYCRAARPGMSEYRQTCTK
ncbi:MAG TPA: glycosyltransferase [Geobacteraceae bacterium]|nr:glycosyltransferase [Geobacteraceae bacterium]